MPEFRMECFQNPYLPRAGSTLDAILTVNAAFGYPAPVATPLPSTRSSDQVPDVAEVIIIDASGSMDGAKMREAKLAATTALVGLREGVRFAVVAGRGKAEMVFPANPELAVANPKTIAAAKSAVAKLRSGGGTSIGHWLHVATTILWYEKGVRHATLLTDGQNGEDRAVFLQAIENARGVFQCDCRGVGADWSVEELRLIADALLGTVDIIADPDGLAADFAAITDRLMGRRSANVAIRVWTPKGVDVVSFKQVAPTVVDLGGASATQEATTQDYPTGAWGDDTRDYHLRLALPSGDVGDEILAARVSLVVDEAVTASALVRGIWTEDLELSTRVNRQVEHYVGQSEMAQAIQDGLAARRVGDLDTARQRLGTATSLAYSAGNDETLDLLARVVDIEDAPSGRVRVKQNVTQVDEMTLDTRSTKTTRVKPGED